MAFVLSLDLPNDPRVLRAEVLGLTLPLRLALTAQASGAAAIVAADPELAASLRDPRLTIPVVAARPSGAFVFRAPANLVVHRGLLSAFKARHGERDWDVAEEPFDHDVAYGFAPITVVDAASRARARRAMLRSLRKPQDGPTSTHFNRYISLFFTRFLVALPLHPNHVSIGILFIGLAGAYLATYGTYWPLVAASVLYQTQSVLDGCDGEMSRLTFRGSRAGEWLDTIGDDLTNYGFFGCAAYGIYRVTANPVYLGLGVSIVTCGVLVSAIEYRYLIKIGSGDLLKYPIGVGSTDKPGAERTLFDRFIVPISKRDTFVLLTVVFTLLGILNVMLFVFAAGALGILVTVLRAELRMAAERRAA
ncbi:MAG: CDP-alcohol phosphatidyltransferase family protein [Polyangiaceae bacterium]|nr:CDP-alcohol phosphatidyltransferase family protein [Polyangiaceae bacterium]